MVMTTEQSTTKYNTMNYRFLSVDRKITFITKIKWVSFGKSQAEELQQKLERFIDKLEALVPVPNTGTQQRVEPVEID